MKDFCIFIKEKFIMDNFIKIKKMAKVSKYIFKIRLFLKEFLKKDRKQVNFW
jgi:hypothetical protein